MRVMGVATWRDVDRSCRFNGNLPFPDATGAVTACLRGSNYVALVTIVAEVQPASSCSATWCRAYIRVMGMATGMHVDRPYRSAPTYILPVAEVRPILEHDLVSRLRVCDGRGDLAWRGRFYRLMLTSVVSARLTWCQCVCAARLTSRL